MRKLWWLFLVAANGALAAGPSQSAEISNDLGFRILKSRGLGKDRHGNRLIAPFSAYLATAMSKMGHHPNDTPPELVRLTAGEWLEEIRAHVASHAALKDRVFATESIAFLSSLRDQPSDFTTRMKNVFAANVLKYDRQQAEKWASDFFKNKVKLAFPTDFPSWDGRPYYVSLSFLESEWNQKYFESTVRKAEFNLGKGRGKGNFDTLYGEGRAKYVNAPGEYEAIELNLGKSAEISAVLVEPTSQLDTFVQTLDAEKWEKIYSRIRDAKEELGEIHVPALKLSARQELTTAYLSPSGGASIEEPHFYHFALLEMTPKGITAAAKSEIGVTITSVPSYRFDCRIDRPYLVAIREKRTGTILWLAAIEEPSN